MIILPCLKVFFTGGYLSHVFVLMLLFSGLFTLFRVSGRGGS